MTRLFDIAACKALHMSRPQPPKISIGIEISQPPMDGGLSSIQRKMNIGGEPHKLAYINSGEADLLHNLGGSGQPVNGIPAFAFGDPDAPGTSGTSGTSGQSGYDDTSIDTGVAPSQSGQHGIADYTTAKNDPDEPGYLTPDEVAALEEGKSAYESVSRAQQRAMAAATPEARTPEARAAIAAGRDALYYMPRQETEYTGPLGEVLNFLFGGFPGSGKYADKMAGILEEGWRSGYWGKRAYHDKAGIKLDYPDPPSDIDTDPNKQIGKPKRKPKEKEKEKSAMEKYLDSIAGRDDDDSDDDDVSERQKWWDDLPDYLKDILKKTYPEEDEYGMPKDLFTDSV